ncbi:MAG: FHA domain-containing protein [Pirellulaceae bacterium]|nr:FHA domain-containing protein [Pirellulaceae bacterium]
MVELQTIFDKRRPQGLLGSPHDELRLRIRGPRCEGQLVVVRVPKCTIGSSESCNFPLNGPGIHPVHCLILRGQRGAVVRCLAPGTTLNGMQVQDATLFTGDRLRIGPYELEVLLTVTNVTDQESPPTTQPIPGVDASILASGANRHVTLDPPSLGGLATTIENRINRIEGQLAVLQQDGGQATTCESKIQEFKLAQEAIASLSRQLDCERERNGTTLESLAAERDRLASELAGATQTASDLCRELEQVRSEHVEIDATSELYSQRITEVSELLTQRIAEVSTEVSADVSADVSAEVEKLAKRITETGQHHQQARDQWQANNDTLEQRLTDGVNQLKQLKQELDLFRCDHEDAEGDRQLQGSQSEETRESVRALKEQLAEQQSQQIEMQAKWVAEHQELHDKFQHLEELHRQIVIQQASEPTMDSPQVPTEEFTPDVTGECEPEHVGEGVLSVADLDGNSRIEPDVSEGPLQWEDEIPNEQQHQTPVSRLDQLKASRVAALQQTKAESTHEYGPFDALNDIETPIKQQSQTIDESEFSPAIDGDAGLGLTSHATAPVSQAGSEDPTNDAPTQPTVSDRDRMFDRLNAPQGDVPAESTVEAHHLDTEPTRPDGSSHAPVEPMPFGMPTHHREAVEIRDGIDIEDGFSSGGAPRYDASAHTAESFDAPSATSVPSAMVDEEAMRSVAGSPVAADDALSRMGQYSDEEHDEPVASGMVDNAPQEDSEQPLSGNTGSQDEDSIEAYMNQLLVRVRGGDSSIAASVEPARPAVESSWKNAGEASENDESLEFVARSQAPEEDSDLSAMRDLANDTTRSAIAAYDMKSGIDVASAKLIAAGAGVTTAALSTLSYESHPLVTFLGVGVGLGSAVMWIWQSYLLKRHSLVIAEASTPDENDDANRETPQSNDCDAPEA